MILNYEELKQVRKNNLNRTIALFKGTFDLFHYDHLMLLSEIKSNCDLLVVEIKSDIDVRRKKGNGRPIIDEYKRAIIIDSIKFTDYTIIANKRERTKLIDELISDNTYKENEISKLLRDGYLIEQLHPNYVYSTDEKTVSEAISDLCDKLNIKIKIIKTRDGLHTTDIINKCKNL